MPHINNCNHKQQPRFEVGNAEYTNLNASMFQYCVKFQMTANVETPKHRQRAVCHHNWRKHKHHATDWTHVTSSIQLQFKLQLKWKASKTHVDKHDKWPIIGTDWFTERAARHVFLL